jgi:hypothetical protein
LNKGTFFDPGIRLSRPTRPVRRAVNANDFPPAPVPTHASVICARGSSLIGRSPRLGSLTIE